MFKVLRSVIKKNIFINEDPVSLNLCGIFWEKVLIVKSLEKYKNNSISVCKNNLFL